MRASILDSLLPMWFFQMCRCCSLGVCAIVPWIVRLVLIHGDVVPVHHVSPCSFGLEAGLEDLVLIPSVLILVPAASLETHFVYGFLPVFSIVCF